MAPLSYNCISELSCCVCNVVQDSIKSLHYHQTYFHSTQELSLASLSLKGWDMNLLMECAGHKSQRENNECQVYYQNGEPINSYSTSVGQQDEDITCKIENIRSSQVNDERENESEKCTLSDTLNSVKMSNDILINDFDKSPPSQEDELLHGSYYEDKPPDRWPIMYPQELNLRSNVILSDSETETDIEVETNEKLFDSDCDMKMEVIDLYKSSFPMRESINFKHKEAGDFNTRRMSHRSYFGKSRFQNETVNNSNLLSGMVSREEQNPVGDLRAIYSSETSRSTTHKMKEETVSSLSSDTILPQKDLLDPNDHVSLPSCSTYVRGINKVNNRRMLYDFPPLMNSDTKSLERDTDFVDFFLFPADIDSKNLNEKCESSDISNGDLQNDAEEDDDRTCPTECIMLDETHKKYRKIETPHEFLEICTDEKASSLTTTQNEVTPMKKYPSFGGFYRAKAITSLVIDLSVSKVSERRFFCESCGKGYKKKSHLERHLRVHTGERPFPCPHCTKRFAVRSILKQHVRIHTGEKPYSCDICSQRFPQKSGLMTHMMLHTGKPFKCEVCSKSFVSNHKLLQHLKGHDSQQKGYTCGKCKLEFFTLGALKVHKAMHNKDSNHMCQECEVSFTNEADLKIHVVKHE